MFLLSMNLSAQKKTKIYIENADKADYDERLGKDVQRLIGNVVMRHDSTYFYSDSAYFNEKTKLLDGFGNIHIKVNDSTDIYSDLLKYNGDKKFAELFYHVILKDDSTVLNTEYMTYDRINHLASYPNHGKITRNDKNLVSKKGYYRDDIKEIYFRKDVVVTTPEHQMFTDTLVYNTNREMMYFYGPTTIINDEKTLTGNYGRYNTETKFVYLDKKATLKNKEQSITADTMYYNNKIGYAKALNNVIIEDTTHKAMLKGNYAELWENLGKGLLTNKSEGLYYEQKDTLHIHADTMFVYFDTLTNNIQLIQAYYNVRFYRKDIQGKCDSMNYNIADSSVKMRIKPVIWSQNSQMTGDSINIVIKDSVIDSVLVYPNAFIIQQDSIKGFNQIKGKQITAYFSDNELDHIYNDGNAETVYWLREEDGSIIGINFSKSVSMNIKIEDNRITRIKYFKKTDEILYPEDQLKENQEYLKDFKWQEDLRPKDKYDIFRKVEKIVEEDNKTRRKRK